MVTRGGHGGPPPAVGPRSTGTKLREEIGLIRVGPAIAKKGLQAYTPRPHLPPY